MLHKTDTTMTDTTTTEAPQLDIARELGELEHLLHLVAFAVDARRILGEIDLVHPLYPDIRQKLGAHIAAPASWVQHDDTAAQVLSVAAHRVGKLFRQVSE